MNSTPNTLSSRTLAEARLQSPPSRLIVEFYEKPHLEREIRQFDEYLQVDIAHTIMLAEQGILGPTHARVILEALEEIAALGASHFPMDPAKGSFLLQVEAFLFDRVGESIGGRMHTGRSRLDQGPTVRRLYKRRHLVEVMNDLVALQESILDLAARHDDTVMPGYTCLQHAHPTTFGHYLLSFCSKLADDFDRLRETYARVNLSPLGAAGLAGTAWPINRERTRELLGFDGLVVNSKLAREAYYAAEMAGALSFVMATLNDLATDLHVWSSHEFGFVQTADEFCGTSSIFPQKKNPAGLEAVKFAAGGSTTWLATALATFRAEGTGDVVMREVPILDSAFTATQGSLTLMAAIVATLTVNKARMEHVANENWSTATNLADQIVRESDLSFREAHSLVARLVRECVDQGIPVGGVNAELLRHAAVALDLPTPGLSTDAVRGCLEARAFVQTRTSAGGTAASQIDELTQSALATVAAQRTWLKACEDKLAAATAARAQAVAQWLRQERPA